jgi:hypothetical protein
MNLINKKRILIPGLIFTVLFVLNQVKSPVVVYLPFNLPDELKASTIPPFGIFIVTEKDVDNGVSCTLLQHEMEHWNQYVEMGLFSFYYEYLKEFFIHDRKNHWMEREANKNCKRKLN